MTEETDLEAPQETPSEAEPVEDVSEPSSDDDVTDEPGDESDAESDESAEAESDEQEAAPPDDSDDDEAWKNFQSKFNHLKSDRDRRAAMGKAFWEKTRYASAQRKENEDLRARLARLEGQATRDEKPPEPAPPPPELARIEQRIQVLYQKDQGYQEQQQKALMSLAEADQQLAVVKARVADTDDEYQKAILEQRLETATLKRESFLQRWADLNDKREAVSLEMEQRLNDRDWTQKFLKEQANRQDTERKSQEQFDVEFPKHVDNLIASSADDLKAPKDPKIRQSLWKSVNRAMMVDLLQLGDKGIAEVNIPAMVKAHVQEFLQDRDLIGRTTFSAKSREKLQATGRAPAPAARPQQLQRVIPSPALLTQSDTSPAMRRAREILTKRFGG